MTAGGLKSIFAAIASKGGKARFAGGAVRDALLGRQAVDIDLAVTLPPDTVMDALRQAGIKTVPTGIDHGTVMAVVGRKGYEITTLRRDVETDGRRAKVAFTDDWQADAARRDFTFNAFYADPDGTVYDYFGGYDDLMAGRVRFIGNAEARIREDVLRILRFFRFYASLGKGEPDPEALSACRALAPLLPQLSAERVWIEIGKLLLADDPVPACRLMADQGILPVILPEAERLGCLQELVRLEKEMRAGADALRRLAAVLKSGSAGDVASRLKMSKQEAGRLRDLALLPLELSGRTDDVPLRRILYPYGAEKVRDGLLLAAAGGAAFDLDAAIRAAEAWETPVFPLLGSDILKMGVVAGPRVGDVLHAVEAWWMERDFRPTKEECLEEARQFLLSGR